MTDDTPIVQAAEQLPVPLVDGVALAARTSDGQIHLGLRDLCATIGLDVTSQRRRIRANESLHLTAIRRTSAAARPSAPAGGCSTSASASAPTPICRPRSTMTRSCLSKSSTALTGREIDAV
jgi:hypothetical protein